MKLIIVRHGQTDWNKKNILQGSSDIPLNEVGKKQAMLLKSKLENEHIDVCIVSPLKRAYETASIICGDKTDILVSDKLVERNLGNLEGKSASLYDGKLYWNLSLNSNSNGVECVLELLSRVKVIYEEIKNKYADKTVLLVAHGAVVRALHYTITGYDSNTDFLSFDVPNCHAFIYEV